MKKEDNEETKAPTEEPEVEEQEAPSEAAETEIKQPETEETGAAEIPTVVKEEEPAAAEEEAKAPKEKKREEEEEIVEERIYTVPLAKAWIMPANKRAPRAMRMLKVFVTKHMKLGTQEKTEEEEEEPSTLTISNEVNFRIWARGIEKPPRKIRVRATKNKEGNVTVYLAEGD